MSVPFTIDATNWQQIEKLEELRLAYSERSYLVTGKYKKFVWDATASIYKWIDGDGTEADKLQNNIPAHGKGFNGQCVEFFSGIQGFLFNNFQLLARSLTDDLAGADNIYFGFASTAGMEFFKSVGGNLWVSETDFGFRHNDGTKDIEGAFVFERGWRTSAAGDVVGYWQVEDILAVLKRYTGYVSTDMVYTGWKKLYYITSSTYYVSYTNTYNGGHPSSGDGPANIATTEFVTSTSLRNATIRNSGATADVYFFKTVTGSPNVAGATPDIPSGIYTRTHIAAPITASYSYGVSGSLIYPCDGFVAFTLFLVIWGNFTNA